MSYYKMNTGRIEIINDQGDIQILFFAKPGIIILFSLIVQMFQNIYLNLPKKISWKMWRERNQMIKLRVY